MSARIPFGRSSIVGRELEYLAQATTGRPLSGDGEFTHRCHRWFVETLACRHALLTHSCTAALELAAIVLDVGPGDEVVMPSFTFVSTANAFVLRGAVPVFVDIRPDTLNLDESLVEDALTERTRAIVPVHYAGVACDMDRIAAIAAARGLAVVEDAAQALMATHKERYLGTLGDMGCLSFHDTKNVSCGEGGALLFRDGTYFERAQVVREKGTNRNAFFRGLVDKYTWVDIGSSYLPGELTAAFLYGQLEHAAPITERRLRLCAMYRERLADLEREGRLRLPRAGAQGSGHIFYVILATPQEREALRLHLEAHNIAAVIHYVPLHSSPFGRRAGRASGSLANTERVADTLLRLPLFHELSEAQIDRVADAVHGFFRR